MSQAKTQEAIAERIAKRRKLACKKYYEKNKVKIKKKPSHKKRKTKPMSVAEKAWIFQQMHNIGMTTGNPHVVVDRLRKEYKQLANVNDKC